MLQDAVVIGGGFYGASIAVYLAKQRGFRKIVLLEQQNGVLTRASYNNQARVHNGYHYPRSFTTAYRSRINFPKFLRDWPDAVRRDFTKIYAIARRNSKITAAQFRRFCRDIGARVEPAGPAIRAMFEERLIEDVFLVEEHAFDARQLAAWAERELKECGVTVLCNTRATGITADSSCSLKVSAIDERGAELSFSCRYAFNCTYAGVNYLRGDFPGSRATVKHELTEMALVRMPGELDDFGITVMDGPFFSLLPFPARGVHTLSHVRYTPHLHWKDEPAVDPYQKLERYNKQSRVDRMLRDAARYLPPILNAQYVGSLFEIKTVLVKNEADDGRPILFEQHRELPGCYSILGGKIDNIYDVLEKLDATRL